MTLAQSPKATRWRLVVVEQRAPVAPRAERAVDPRVAATNQPAVVVKVAGVVKVAEAELIPRLKPWKVVWPDLKKKLDSLVKATMAKAGQSKLCFVDKSKL
jgi:hypothetical protein